MDPMPAHDPIAPLDPADRPGDGPIDPHQSGAAASEGSAPNAEPHEPAGRSHVAAEATDGDAPDGAAEPVSEGPSQLDAVISRRVNLRTFLILGAVVGAILAVVLTFAFPEHPDFTRGQVLGFFLVFITALTAVVFAAIGLIVDAVVSRRRGTATIRRVRD